VLLNARWASARGAGLELEDRTSPYFRRLGGVWETHVHIGIGAAILILGIIHFAIISSGFRLMLGVVLAGVVGLFVYEANIASSRLATEYVDQDCWGASGDSDGPRCASVASRDTGGYFGDIGREPTVHCP
jgi:hypothetical protein